VDISLRWDGLLLKIYFVYKMTAQFSSTISSWTSKELLEWDRYKYIYSKTCFSDYLYLALTCTMWQFWFPFTVHFILIKHLFSNHLSLCNPWSMFPWNVTQDSLFDCTLNKNHMKTYCILRTIGRYLFSSTRWLRPIVHIDLYKDEVKKIWNP
jgi:hypothetical protein